MKKNKVQNFVEGHSDDKLEKNIHLSNNQVEAIKKLSGYFGVDFKDMVMFLVYWQFKTEPEAQQVFVNIEGSEKHTIYLTKKQTKTIEGIAVDFHTSFENVVKFLVHKQLVLMDKTAKKFNIQYQAKLN